MLYVMSYRADYQLTCSRSCNCHYGGGSSDLEMRSFSTEEETINYLANRLFQHPHARFSNYVVDTWEAFQYAASEMCDREVSGVDSIYVPNADPFNNNLVEDYEHFEEEERRLSLLWGRLREGVTAKLDQLKDAAKKAAEQKRLAEQAATMRATEARERVEYEKYKQKYGI